MADVATPAKTDAASVTDEILKIESLTPEQEAQFAPWVDQWTKKGLSTERADRPKAMRAIRGLYAQSDLEQVPIAWVSSPIVGALAASLTSVIVPGLHMLFADLDKEHGMEPLPKVLYDQHPELDREADEGFPAYLHQTLDEVSDDWIACDDHNVTGAVDMIVNQVLNMELAPRLDHIAEVHGHKVANRIAIKIGMKVSSLVTRTMMKEQLEWHAWYGGQFWCAFAAWATFFRDVLGVNVPQIEHEAHLCESAGYIWPNEKFCFVCERPDRLTVVQDRLDDSDGPAMSYPDGWKLWFIAGVRVNKQIVMSPESQTLEEIKSTDNEEVKRIRINRWGGRNERGEFDTVKGWQRYIDEAGAIELDSTHNDIENTNELLVKTADDMVVFICHCPSTGRTYALDCQAAITTCAQARESLFQGNSLTTGPNAQPFRIVGRS